MSSSNVTGGSAAVTSRRDFLIAATGLLAAAPVMARATEGSNVIRVVDTRLVQAAKPLTLPGITTIDVAAGEYALWRVLGTLRGPQRVLGETTWVDFIVVRGQLEERGLRVRKYRSTSSIITWEMS